MVELIKIEIYTDGSCKNVKGSTTEPTGIGVAVFIDNEYSEEYSLGVPGPLGTNNIAEWSAFIKGLEIAKELKQDLQYLITETEIEKVELEILLISDSQIVLKQFSKEYSVKQKHLKKYFDKAIEIAESIKYLETKWTKGHIGTEGNEKADKLAHQGRMISMYGELAYYFHDNSDTIFIGKDKGDYYIEGGEELRKLGPAIDCNEVELKNLIGKNNDYYLQENWSTLSICFNRPEEQDA